MKVKIQRVRDGGHPSEVVVAVTTADGDQETLVVDQRSLEDDTLEVGYPVGSDNGRLLVELPRETSSGMWRIWIPSDALVREGAVV